MTDASSAAPRVSLIVPVYNEGDQTTTCLDRIFDAVSLPCEVLVVYDTPDDTSAPYVDRYPDDRAVGVLNRKGPGPANAIRAGMEEAAAPVIVVTMVDGSDDLTITDHMVRLVERGFAVVAASRYMPGGAQVGGPVVKQSLSRLAGLILHYVARVGTKDATNSFKAYSRLFLEEVGVSSSHGFEVALEVVAKARRLRRPVTEVPTIWLDRTQGESRFQTARWLPVYLRWFFFAFGRRLTVEQVRVASAAEPGSLG